MRSRICMMEERKTKRFSGDSFGNLDRSNAGPDMETEVAVSNDLNNGRPDYKHHELKDNISVVILNPFMNTSAADDTEQYDDQNHLEMRKEEDAVQVTNISNLEGNENSGNLANTSKEDKPFDNYDTHLRDDLSSEVVLPIPIEHETYTLEDKNATDCDNVIHGHKMEEHCQKSEDIQECPADDDVSGHASENHKEGNTARTSFSHPLEETETEVVNGQDVGAVAEESNSNEDKDSSDDNVDDEQEKGVEEEEGSDYLLLETPTRPQTRSTLREVPGGMRAKANTPASLYTNTVEGLDSPSTPQAAQIDSVRGASRGSRDEVFQRAMTLMSNRCTSARGEDEELFSSREPPFGIHIPQYFYVQQSKPSPMSPLKVWRGYKGNVYFEPINVRRISSAHANTYNSQLDRVASEQARQSVASSAGTRFGNSISRGPTTPLTRATTAASGQASRPYRYIEPVPSSVPQVFVMDKQAVVKAIRNSGASGGQSSKDVQRDLHFIEGMESTGSLAVRPLSGNLLIGEGGSRSFTKSGRHRDRKLLYKRDRLCKGPNFSAMERRGKESGNDTTSAAASHRKASTHSTVLTSPRTSSRISAYRPGSRSAGPGVRPHRLSMTFPENEPNLVVSGDKFAPPTVMSPLLRSTGQFSLGVGGDEEEIGGHRAAANSPDLVDARGMMMSMAISPPLDPMRISMQHANSSTFDHNGIRAAHTSNGAFRERTGRGRRNTTRPLTCSEELKPFIKYSHDVKMNYERNNVNYC